ncbi:lipocalin-like protein [Bradyrhizobium macuxiense]|uniref:Lipocalin-like protein n=1 Tax=Bradyrhizobium macuxiense TaxID=1755647 RepID=A0A560L7R7_9BRAD|nr:lipocalin-like domain-containing protein [Bradyrhizobium macuxiense]TWB91327.1 lipocalin-like protein [Bradyrhizobium macuxiense]
MVLLRVLAAAVVCVCFQAGVALADNAAGQLAGSWKLSSWTIQIIGGEATEPFGPNPKGRAIFAADGYVTFVIVAANRKPATSNEESATLLRSLLAYSGKFMIEGDKFTTKVDISGNELLTGQDQIRFFKLEGDKLIIRTAEQVSSVFPGKRVVGSLTWERER